MTSTQFIILLLLVCSVCGGTACRRAATNGPPTAAPRNVMRDGKIVLGSPSLTYGIPGEGPLTGPEIQRWLDDPINHQTLDFVLPTSLAADEASVVLPDDNPLTRAKIELGRQLFFDKRLSGIGTFSCATCHRPEQSYTSYQVMPEVGRNASAVFNRILGSEHFWDGRAASLEDQPLSPIKNPFEMNSTPEKSVTKIDNVPGYHMQFEAIFGSVSFENICKALACFERVIVTGESAWDRDELTASARRGEALFFGDRLGCGDCHTGRNLTDEDYHNLGTVRLGDNDDLGRFEVTQAIVDRGSFKTPSLRNVAITPPYMHNGQIGSLEEVIEFFDQGGLAAPNGESPLKPLGLTDAEKQDVLEFLSSLTCELTPIETGRLPE